MIEYLLLLLLPVAVYFGWWLARAIERRSSGKRKRLFSDQYFQGLNYLLNEQPDKAIQVFLELAEVNQETVETHMALGNLFRRRGEVDRAIRFHQNIIAKHGLQPEQRTQALLELGEDYMRAGLLDRAERLFSELIETDAHTPSALRSLLELGQGIGAGSAPRAGQRRAHGRRHGAVQLRNGRGGAGRHRPRAGPAAPAPRAPP
jgi:lipopolysaccharide biosynthesis regulator YciM